MEEVVFTHGVTLDKYIGDAPVRVGIGPHRLEFAVIGDTVIVASRLEQLARTIDSTIAAGGGLVAEVQHGGGGEALLEGFRERSSQEILGRSGVITVWAK